jgi:hypothetical protein
MRLDSTNTYFYDQYPMFHVYGAFFSYFSFVYFIMNFFVFLIVDTTIEVIILVKLRQEMKERLRKMRTANSDHRNSVTTRLKRIESENKKEKRAIVMVIMNGTINFVLRFPEFFSFLLNSDQLFKNNVMYKYFCSHINMCTYLLEIPNFFYILTFITSCLIYYLFNTKFRQLVQFWTHVKKK